MVKTYLFKVEAATEKTCAEAMQAAADIVKSVPHDDLIWLAKTAKAKPGLVAKARGYESYF